MTKIFRNVAQIKGRTKSTTSIILLATSTERECNQWGKFSLAWEIIKIQLHVIRNKLPNMDLIVVSNNNYNNILSLKDQYNLRIVPHLNQVNENEMQDIKFGLSSCLSDNVIIICGNVFFSDDILQRISAGEKSKILVDEGDPQLQRENIGVVVDNGEVVNFGYDIFPKWGKIVYFNNKDFTDFADLILKNNHAQQFLFEGLNRFIEQYTPISTYSPRNYFLGKVYTGGDIKRGKQYYGIS